MVSCLFKVDENSKTNSRTKKTTEVPKTVGQKNLRYSRNPNRKRLKQRTSSTRPNSEYPNHSRAEIFHKRHTNKTLKHLTQDNREARSPILFDQENSPRKAPKSPWKSYDEKPQTKKQITQTETLNAMAEHPEATPNSIFSTNAPTEPKPKGIRPTQRDMGKTE